MDKQAEYYLHCGIKTSWHTKTLSMFTNDAVALEKVEKYVKEAPKFRSEGIGLYLWGANGTGKTHLMNCAFKEFISKRYKVRIFSIDEIVDKYTMSWYSDEDKQELTQMLRTVDFLGIDEFGKNVDQDGNARYLPELVKRVVESTIRYRVQMRLPMWFASNTEPKFVKEVFSEDVASLLKEAVIPVLVKGSDYRGKISEQHKKLL